MVKMISRKKKMMKGWKRVTKRIIDLLVFFFLWEAYEVECIHTNANTKLV